MNIIAVVIATIAFAVLAPVIGCLLSGIDRKVSARMQGRVGPPLLQPYYDVRKLLGKEHASVNGSEGIYIWAALLFTFIAGGIFFSGGNLLLCIFIITLATLFFIIAAYSTRSPYAEIGAQRETLQVMAYEPMVLILAVTFCLAVSNQNLDIVTVGSFDVIQVIGLDMPIISTAWIVFIGLLYVLTIKLRKSPFDISSSHHAHQELVKGITTEMSGKTLAKVEIMHWCETVLFLGWVGMFFVWSNPISILIAIAVMIVVYLLEVWIDNNFARVKWQLMLGSSWVIAFICGVVNIGILVYL